MRAEVEQLLGGGGVVLCVPQNGGDGDRLAGGEGPVPRPQADRAAVYPPSAGNCEPAKLQEIVLVGTHENGKTQLGEHHLL